MRQLWRLPTLRTIVVYGAAGAGFAGANLILARVLPTAEYAVFTLFISLGNLGYSLAPTGVDGIVNRRHLEAGPRLLGRVLAASSTVGAIMCLVGYLAYDLPPWIAALLFVSTAAGGAMMVAGAKFQSEQRFVVSLSLIQSPNIVLLIAAVAVALSHAQQAWLAILISTLGFLTAATCGWGRLFVERHHKPHREVAFPWSEALSFAGLEVAGLVLVQLERLVIPHVLTERDLATYGVLAAIAGSLFRVMQMGVGYSLLPRLRAATSVEQRRRLIAREAELIGVIVLLGCAAIWLVTPVIERSFLAGKYHLSASLVLAALVGGVVKILNAFTKSTVSALAARRELAVLNLLGWASVGLAIAASVFGARWGLAGVMYGVSFGWLVRALTALYPIMRHLRLPTSVPVPAP